MADLFDPDADFDRRPAGELVDLARATRTPIGTRARAVTALGRRAPTVDLVGQLAAMGRAEEMREARMFELVSLSYLAVAGLVHAGSTEALSAAREIIADLPTGDRTSLLAFLRSGGLDPQPAE